MLIPYSPAMADAFAEACQIEHVFGSRIACLLAAQHTQTKPSAVAAPVTGAQNNEIPDSGGVDSDRFYLAQNGNTIVGALALHDGVLSVSATEEISAEEVAAFVRANTVREVDASYELGARLQKLLDGELESSYYMFCRELAPEDAGATDCHVQMVPGDPEQVFAVLQASHEYYRTHLQFAPWIREQQARIAQGAEVFQLVLDGEPDGAGIDSASGIDTGSGCIDSASGSVSSSGFNSPSGIVIGTGSIVSADDECAVIGAVAVVPEMRGRGFGRLISRFLTERIHSRGKVARLIAGYDEVAALYRSIGFEECGRWGELYL